MASSARIDELKKKFDENPRRYFAPLANEYRKVGDLDQALFICEAYLPQQPGHMSGHIVYAQTLFEIGRFDDAKTAFGTALALDPENLIALRHLGDIARQAGDLVTARDWYQRVLEADPRNEEIVEVMSSLNKVTSSGAASAAAPDAPTVTETSPHAKWTPPVSAAPPMRAPAPAAPAPPARDDFAEDDDLLDLDSMMIGETPLSTPAVPSPAAPAAADASFESDPLAIAANEPPMIELATDMHLGLVDDGTQSDVAPATDAQPLEGLRSFEAGILPERAEIVDSSLEMEPFYDILHGDASPRHEPAAEPVASSQEDASAASVSSETTETVEAAPPHADADERVATPAMSSPPALEPPPPVAGEIFVTETMAELYLQQGHLDSALDIYRKLLEQRPHDALLLERVRSVEERVFGRSATPAIDTEAFESVDVALSADIDSGPTIREFLSALIGRGARGSQTNGSGEGRSTQTTPRHTLPGSIDAMFPHADSSSGDSSAATALGEAFGMEDFGAGSPDDAAPPADGNDPVASGKTPPLSQAASEGFSFDQFFAGDANVAPPKPSTGAGAPPVESADDVAQFNAWLNGLKKT